MRLTSAHPKLHRLIRSLYNDSVLCTCPGFVAFTADSSIEVGDVTVENFMAAEAILNDASIDAYLEGGVDDGGFPVPTVEIVVASWARHVGLE